MTSLMLESLVSPNITPYIEELIRNSRIGICAGNVRLKDIQSGSFSLQKKPCGDRFKLVIPYAGLSVTWEIVFFGSASNFPPDFLFDDDSFEPDLESIESLNNWKNDDSKSLLRVVQELMESYRKHQVSLIENYSRLQFEYSSLVQQAGFSENDVEVQVNKTDRSGPVNFLIKLPVDFSCIPPILCMENPDEDSAVLLITFHSADGTKITPQLFLSPRVEEVLGGSTSLRIPAFPSGGCLMDYVPNVSQLLKNKVDQIVNGFEKRKEYFAAFLSHFGSSVLEYDTVGLSKLSFLLEWKDFYFALHIEIPRYFPQENPEFIFQSIYHTSHGRPYIASCLDYPYSPRWSGNEMAERARLYILNYIPIFQKNSIRSTK